MILVLVPQAKSDIHSTISRQLERLRSREVWLLGQVDLVQQAKDGVLHSQSEKLHQALGGLNHVLNLDSKAEQLDTVIKDTLDK